MHENELNTILIMRLFMHTIRTHTKNSVRGLNKDTISKRYNAFFFWYKECTIQQQEVKYEMFFCALCGVFHGFQ